jgi:hypothetical protein
MLVPVDLKVNCTVKRKRDKDQLLIEEHADNRYQSGKLSLADKEVIS